MPKTPVNDKRLVTGFDQKLRDTIMTKLNEALIECRNSNERSSASEKRLLDELLKLKNVKPLMPRDKRRIYTVAEAANDDCLAEESNLRKTLSLVFDFYGTMPINASNIKAHNLRIPLFVPSEPDEIAPPLCGKIPAEPDFVSKPDSVVAVYSSKKWMLAKVTKYDAKDKQFVVEKVTPGGVDTLCVAADRVVPLPLMRANPTSNPEALYKENETVGALHPESIYFHQAIIVKPPEDATDGYSVKFRSTPTSPFDFVSEVAQRFIISFRPTLDHREEPAPATTAAATAAAAAAASS